MTNRKAHEQFAGMNLDDRFFTFNDIDPDAPYSLPDKVGSIMDAAKKLTKHIKQQFGDYPQTKKPCQDSPGRSLAISTLVSQLSYRIHPFIRAMQI